GYSGADRRRVLAIYELAGETTRAKEIAVEIGWWAAVARLSAREVDRLGEAEAWWDAGQPELCGLALAGVRDTSEQAEELRALLAGHDLSEQAADRAEPDGYMMAARFALAAGKPGVAQSWLGP